MILKFDYIEHKLELSSEWVVSIEVENKQMLCRIIRDFYHLENNGYSDAIQIFDKNYNELKIRNIKVIGNLFTIEEQLKKYTNDFVKLMIQTLNEKQSYALNNLYNKNNSLIGKIIMDSDFPLEVEIQSSEVLLKNAKIKFKKFDDLLSSILNLIDIENSLNIHGFIVLVGLKQYLTNEELEEFYKYVLYNNQKIVLVDYSLGGIPSNHEKKLIIDENLEEFML